LPKTEVREARSRGLISLIIDSFTLAGRVLEALVADGKRRRITPQRNPWPIT
jgi:hypothetical protein